MINNRNHEVIEKLDSFFIQYKQQIYKKGEILIRADDNPLGIFFLKSGIIKKYVISKKGDELVVNLFKPDSFFPMSWAINDTPNIYYYEARTDAEVWRAPKDAVLTFIQENPDILYDLLQRVYMGTAGILLRMTYLMSGSAYSRLITEILIHAKRFGEECLPSDLLDVSKSHKNAVIIHISENDLAMQSGMTRETISRELKILKEKRLVTFIKNSLVVLDTEALEFELSGD